jgi:phytoene synthase
MDGTAAELCADQLRRFDRARYLTALFAPREARAGLWAVYAFALEIGRARAPREEIAREIRLQWWRDAVDAIFAGTEQETPTGRGLADAVRRHGLSRARLEALIEAEEPEAAVLSVQLALEVLGATDDGSMEAARQVGLAYATGNPSHRAAARRARPAPRALPALLLRRGGPLGLPLRMAWDYWVRRAP